MEYDILARVLGALCEVPYHWPTIAGEACASEFETLGALRVLTARGVAVRRFDVWSLPAAMSQTQAQVLLALDDAGALSDAALASRLAVPAHVVTAALWDLSRAHRVSEVRRLWQRAA